MTTATPSTSIENFNFTQTAQIILALFQEHLSRTLVKSAEELKERNPDLPFEVLNNLAHRFQLGYSYMEPNLSLLVRWLYESREDTNFTYDLTQLNRQYMAAMIAIVTNLSPKKISEYISEIDKNQSLKNHIKQLVEVSSFRSVSDEVIAYSRRIGWYAFVRALKPRLVIETGVDKGMGSCVLAAALQLNSLEGFPGRYLGIDINPNAGYLFKGEYTSFGTIIYADSLTTLAALKEPVDLFINDSDHSADYEEKEYNMILPRITPHGVILGDNAHVTSKLCNFSERNNRKFLFIPEKPAEHWYPGAGIGVSYA
jgi:cephalosporin hydroxylase